MAIAVCAVSALTLGIGEADQQLNGSNPRVYDFKGAVHAVEQRARPGDVLLYSPQYLDHVVAYYRDGSGVRMRPQFRKAASDAVHRLDARYRLVGQDKRPQIRTWEFQR